MLKIFKYQIPDNSRTSFELEMPVGSKILKAGPQGTREMVWAIVDLDVSPRTEIRYFKVYGTGDPINESIEHIEYLGSWHNPFAWHLFEIKKLDK